MAYGSSYKSSSGVGAEQPTAAPERPSTGSGSPMRGVTSSTLPSSTIDGKRNTDNAPLKFPEDLADDFYISFNTFKYTSERPQEAKRTFRPIKSIVLPIPSNMTDGYSAGYNAQNLFIAGNAIREAATSSFNQNGIGGTVKTAFSKEGLNNATAKVADVLDAMSGNMPAIAGKAALAGAVYFAEGVGGQLGAAAKSSLQLSVNPFPVMIFQGTSFKPAFSFDWVFYPESNSEAVTIQKIIGFFRKEMLPERDETNISILKTPAIFEIKINPVGIGRTYKRCVLTNMGINYSPNGPSYLVDTTANSGQKWPSSIAVSLTFQEIEVWLANDYHNEEEFFFGPRPEFTK